MTILSLVFAELRFRLLNVVLAVLAVATAAALFVAGPTLLGGYARDTHNRLETLQQQNDAKLVELMSKSDAELAELDKQTVRIMRDIGVNLKIIHKDTKMDGLYAEFVVPQFPQSYVDQLAESTTVETIAHLVATLQEKRKWNGRTILLTGIHTVLTNSQLAEGKGHMTPKVDPGTVLVGSELGQGLNPGDVIDVDGHKLTVKKVQPESGTEADITLMTNLADAQQIMNAEGKITMIMAQSCKCHGDRISTIRRQLEQELPDTKVVEVSNLATAREMQRDLVAKKAEQQSTLLKEKSDEQRELLASSRSRAEATIASLVGFSTPLVVLASAVFVGLLTWLNVRERRPEIGLLRALGKGTAAIAGLFLGKAVLLGLLGGMLGAAIGYAAALLIGGSMQIPASLFQADPLIVLGTLLGAPLIAALASYLPTLVAVSQDPAVVLMDA
jgi:hypothetical protein